MRRQTRRRFLGAVGAAACVVAMPQAARADGPGAKDVLSLGFSLYGMKGLSTEKALRAVSNIGFDSAELCLLDEWDAAPQRLDTARRKAIRTLLDGEGLSLPALMENVSLAGSPASQQPVLERLKQATQLAHDCYPDSPPLVETTAGGGKWSELREQLRDNLGGWATLARSSETVICVKPHRSGVIDRPEYGVWLVEQIDSPWIKLAYDYSHFSHRDISLEESIRVMLPYAPFMHVKDTVMSDGKFRFVLPGESGEFDYAKLLELVVAAGYRGDICCEVSGMVSNRPDYDPIAAAKTCYRNLARAFELAGIRRPGDTR